MSKGLSGTSNLPLVCPDCGGEWTSVERLHTGDDKGIDGYEDWAYCRTCNEELFYPVIGQPDE